MIVQHIEMTAIERKRAKQVAKILMPNLVGDDNAPHCNRVKRYATDVCKTRNGRTAVGNTGRHHEAVDGLDAAVHLAEWCRSEHRHKGVFGRHLILRFHADVINLIFLGIGIHNIFRAAATQ